MAIEEIGNDDSRKTPSSPPLTGTPKLQLFVKRPLVKKMGAYQKKTFYNERYNEGSIRWAGGAKLQYSQVLYSQMGDQNESIITIARFSQRSEGFESHIWLPSLAILCWEDKLKEHLL